MKTSPLLQHIVLALALTCLAAINGFILRQCFGGMLSSQLNIAIITFVYLAYLSWQSRTAVGRITLLLIDASILFTCLFASLSLVALLCVCLAMIWLNRSLLCYFRPFAILADLGLCLFSLYIAYGLLINGIGFIGILWCVLLLQALHSLIPDKRNLNKASQIPVSDNFDHALQSAEVALQQLLKRV